MDDLELEGLGLTQYDLITVGGGAAGFFGSLSAKEAHPSKKVLILERTHSLLNKVRISGGGRCNVTHSCFDPILLSKNYPRGAKELIGPFHRFQARDIVNWFLARGVHLKTEADGRMFPLTDSSQTIIDCLMKEARKLKVEIQLGVKIIDIKKEGDVFLIQMEDGNIYTSSHVLLATGSHPQGHAFAKSFGHTIQEPVPSLFTFNIPQSPLSGLEGITLKNVNLQLNGFPFVQSGPLLITHWGLSGPAALKLSAWAAHFLHERKYQAELIVNWLPEYSFDDLIHRLRKEKEDHPAQMIVSQNPFNLPRSLWKRLMERVLGEDVRFSQLSKDKLFKLAESLLKDKFHINGKTTNKEEFVTAGGVTLNEVNFKTMESKECLGLFFAGEILDIDAVTGGFNFQNAWTTGWIVGQSIN